MEEMNVSTPCKNKTGLDYCPIIDCSYLKKRREIIDLHVIADDNSSKIIRRHDESKFSLQFFLT